MTASGARAAALKCVEAGEYRKAVKILVEASKTGVLTDRDDSSAFDLVQMLHAMVKRNLYPEISKIIQIVWNTEDTKKSNYLRTKVLTAYAPNVLVKRLVTAHYHEEACRCLTEFKLKEDLETTTFVLIQVKLFLTLTR